MDTKNGRDNSPPEGEKPIIDQMTDLAAQAAGTLAETAVKTGAKKAKKAVARRLPGPVKKAAKSCENRSNQIQSDQSHRYEIPLCES